MTTTHTLNGTRQREIEDLRCKNGKTTIVLNCKTCRGNGYTRTHQP